MSGGPQLSGPISFYKASSFNWPRAGKYNVVTRTLPIPTSWVERRITKKNGRELRVFLPAGRSK